MSENMRDYMRRIGLFILFLICGLSIFLFGVDYFTISPTNTSALYKVGLSALFLVATLLLWRSERYKAYWPAAFAFFAASLTNVTSWYFVASLQRWVLNLLHLSPLLPPGVAVGKWCDALVRVATILILVKLAGDDLGSVYIKKTNLRWSIIIGVLAVIHYTAASIIVAVARGASIMDFAPNIPWALAFGLANGFWEELWCRGLFLKRLQPVLGAGATLWLTSLLFGMMHLGATYMTSLPQTLVFVLVTLTLGFAFGLVMQKTDSIWGAAWWHASVDLYQIVGFGI
jgi:membrane protease YdiL (CAAX protease family)